MEDCEKTISEDGKTIVYTRGGQFVAKCVKTTDAEHWYNADGKHHRDDGPAEICYENGQKIREYWYRDGIWHRIDGPTVISYENGQKTCEGWYHNDKRHRDNGPALIYYHDSQITEKWWFRDGKFDTDVLAYIWSANTNDYPRIYVSGKKINTLDEFRNFVKSPLALGLMRPLPIPIRDAIYEHYCMQ